MILRFALALTVFAGGSIAQVAPVPADPLELVTGQTNVPAGAQQRATVVALMENAINNHNLHMHGNNPFDLRVSFSAAASTLYPAAQGTLEETWVSGQHWRWTATLGGYSQLQIGWNGGVYGQSKAPMPMRLKTLREALFAPFPGAGRRVTIRTSAVSWNGVPLTCVLTSASGNQQTPANGRQWYENEYCIDPATNTLRILSIAPGMYAAYDYSNGHKFHDHLLPGRITVTENGATTVDAQINSVSDADASNLSIYQPTQQMLDQGAAPVSAMPARFPMILPGSPNTVTQPVIVHVTLDASGKILEMEALQSNANTVSALRAAMANSFGPAPVPDGASPPLREAFINVQFRGSRP
jgi:hypothetical protein